MPTVEINEELERRWQTYKKTQNCPDCDSTEFMIRKMQNPRTHWKFTCKQCRSTWADPSKLYNK